MDGFGTKFYRSSDQGSTYAQVANMYDFTPPDQTGETYDDSPMDRASRYKEFEGGDIDPGNMSFTLRWNEGDAGQAALYSDFEDRIKGYYRVEYPDGTTVDFRGIISNWGGPSAPQNDKITRTVGIKISGKPTVTTP